MVRERAALKSQFANRRAKVLVPVLACLAILHAAAISGRVTFAKADLVGVDPAFAEGDLLGTGDLDALPMLDRCNELAGLQHRFMGTGIEPCVTPAKNLDSEPADLKVGANDIENFQLAAR